LSASRLGFWFDFGSTYSYVSAARIEDEASVTGVLYPGNLYS
jgi:2-hydroxychromene-2-carboxylate isomerase